MCVFLLLSSSPSSASCTASLLDGHTEQSDLKRDSQRYQQGTFLFVYKITVIYPFNEKKKVGAAYGGATAVVL